MYQNLKQKLAEGWNTWNTRSVLSHVLLPEAFAINICFKEYQVHTDRYLKEALIGRKDENREIIHPIAHTYDGSYTCLNMKWLGMEVDIQSAVMDEDLYLLVTPIKNQKYPVTLVLESGILWNHEGTICLDGDSIVFTSCTKAIRVFATGKVITEKNVPSHTPYLALELSQPIGVCTGKKRSIEEIMSAITLKKAEHDKTRMRFGSLSDVYDAMQSSLAWDTIYEPGKDRVITTVSRLWNVSWGGYVLFCWDSYFTALMASLDNKELAYANLIEITREKTEKGFVPNFAADPDCKSRDRSQPPVGSMCARQIYHRYKEKWLLEEVFEDLYTWNRWWLENRVVDKGLLAWGTNPFEDIYGGGCEIHGVGARHGASLESGMDNSPMYDDIPYNKEKQCLELADVGLTSLFIMDCIALAEIAGILGDQDKEALLLQSTEEFSKGLLTLWNNEAGIFQNKRTDNGEWNQRISPTNFYALVSGRASQEQSTRMANEHFYNPDEFWGEWMIPSISRSDPAFVEQDYWRGRIWAPLNFLVYLAFKKAGNKKVCKDLSDKSIQLLLNEWLKVGHVYENYNAITGEGRGINSCDPFYCWGGLLSLIALAEHGFFELSI